MKKRKKDMHEGKLHEVPLGGSETDEEVAEEAGRAEEEAMRESDEHERVEKAIKEEGFIPYEERKKERETGPGRKLALALLEELRKKEEEKTGKKEKLF